MQEDTINDNPEQVLKKISFSLTMLATIFIITMVGLLVVRIAFTSNEHKNLSETTRENISYSMHNNATSFQAAVADGSLSKAEYLTSNINRMISLNDQILTSLYSSEVNVGTQKPLNQNQYILSPGVDKNNVQYDKDVLAGYDYFLLSQTNSKDSEVSAINFQTTTGLMLSSDTKTNENEGSYDNVDYRKRTWYTDALKSPSKIIISLPYDTASYEKVKTISYSKAVMVNNKVVGVVEADIDITNVKNNSFSLLPNTSIIDKSGSIISNLTNSESNLKVISDNKDTISSVLKKFINDNNKITIALNDKQEAIALFPKNTPWGFLIIFSYTNIEQSMNSIISSFLHDNNEIMSTSLTFSIILFLVLLFVILFTIIVIMRYIKKVLSTSEFANSGTVDIAQRDNARK